MMDYVQTELNLGVASIPAFREEWRSPQYDLTWDRQPEAVQPTCKSVGEQVTEDTFKFAHQHVSTHFIEKYWVERRGEKYWYWRYTWMEGRKLRRKYIGSVISAKARRRKQVVEEYIRGDYTPNEITTLISHFSTTTEIH